ncbi:MAG TPA: EAL domain-containing protein [Burkholderiales bacterium]|nr:EAL domain-containing protein [Burkholderiales bacterium]
MLKKLVGQIRTAPEPVEARGDSRGFATMLGLVQDAAIVTDKSNKIVYLNPAAERLTGWSNAAAQGMNSSQIVKLAGDPTNASLADPIEQALLQARTITLPASCTIVQRLGTRLPVEGHVAPMLDNEARLKGVVIMLRDMSQSRATASRLAHEAHHDPLTGLINRREFERRAERALSSAWTQSSQHALCYIDLDRFKIVNDTCGHSAGDELLRQIARVLQGSVCRREGDTLARLGGDEFGVLLQSCPLTQAQKIAYEVLGVIKDFRFDWQGRTFTVGASIGLTAINAASKDLASVFSAADTACYAAKEKGRNRIQVYRSGDPELAARFGEVRWVNEINQALEHDRFTLFFQPLVRLNGVKSLARHCEILLRMIGSANQLIPPAHFIPAAERYNLMPLLDRWAIAEAFSAWGKLNSEGNLGTTLSLNVSAVTLGSDGIVTFVREQSAKHKVPGNAICFEITETEAFAHTAQVMNFIWGLKMDGYRFALDHFGAGMSSFSYLKTLPLDYLKIDGELIKDVVSDKVSLSMVEAICRIAQGMDLETIAERVESPVALKKLKELGVNYAQGNITGQPAPLETWIAESKLRGKDEKPLIAPLKLPN